MTRLRDIELLPLDSKIEKTYRRNWMAWNQSTTLRDTMVESREGANTKALCDYVTSTFMDAIFGIRRLPILANNVKIKLVIIQMIQANQFSGSQAKDLNAHIARFLEICDTFKHNGVTDDCHKTEIIPFLFEG